MAHAIRKLKSESNNAATDNMSSAFKYRDIITQHDIYYDAI
jgi:hypothetical protein